MVRPWHFRTKHLFRRADAALTEDLRRHVVEFDGRFTLDERMVKPIPGKEKDYAAQAGELSDVENVNVEPPDPAFVGATRRDAGRPWWKFW